MLKLIVSAEAYIEERDWLETGWRIWEALSEEAGCRERDFLLTFAYDGIGAYLKEDGHISRRQRNEPSPVPRTPVSLHRRVGASHGNWSGMHLVGTLGASDDENMGGGSRCA